MQCMPDVTVYTEKSTPDMPLFVQSGPCTDEMKTHKRPPAGISSGCLLKSWNVGGRSSFGGARWGEEEQARQVGPGAFYEA